LFSLQLGNKGEFTELATRDGIGDAGLNKTPAPGSGLRCARTGFARSDTPGGRFDQAVYLVSKQPSAIIVGDLEPMRFGRDDFPDVKTREFRISGTEDHVECMFAAKRLHRIFAPVGDFPRLPANFADLAAGKLCDSDGNPDGILKVGRHVFLEMDDASEKSPALAAKSHLEIPGMRAQNSFDLEKKVEHQRKPPALDRWFVVMELKSPEIHFSLPVVGRGRGDRTRPLQPVWPLSAIYKVAPLARAAPELIS